jgi:3-hydroxyacyl-CoA dehydrogenase / enoyl-CoA hydratase / 3-hydroxybutyryl-CoA epimerase
MPEVSYELDHSTKVATMAIDTDGPVNTIGTQFLADLERAVASAKNDNVAGVIFVSRKRKSFLDGANLKEILTGDTPELVRSVAIRYQTVLESLARSPFPVVAILDGQTALGGGFELLLWACDHIFTTRASRLGLPEVGVGLFPAGGGTQTLRRVVGFKSALDMIMNARMNSPDAFRTSGVFTICPSDELAPRATTWLHEHRGIINRNYDPDFQEPDAIPDQEKQRALNQARFRFTISPFRPYLAAAIEAVEGGLTLPFEQAVRKEVELFVPLLFNPYTRNKIDLFFLVTSMGPRLVRVDPANAIRADRMAIIGSGLMGRGIAQVAAERGIRTTLIDIDETTAKNSVARIDRTLSDLVERGRWPKERKDALMAHITWAKDYHCLKEIPLVVESVFEDLALKREILARVQQVNPEAIFASNTSTLPIAEISQGAKRPEKVVGMHYFSPVPLMPLLEVIRGPQSSPTAIATAVTAGRIMGKTAILVNDGPGFYTSRTFANYLMHGMRLIELGLSPWDVDLIALRSGFPQGPLHIYGTTGGNVIYHAGRFLAERFPDRLPLSQTLVRLHEAGYTGGANPSFYLDPRKMTPDKSVLDYISPAAGLPTPTDEEAADILLLGMVNEAFWCMSDGVLPDYYSMDLGAALGIGFPDCLHGPARYVKQNGVEKVKSRLEELHQKFALSSLRPAPEFERIISGDNHSALI